MDEAVLQLCAQVTDEAPGRISLGTPLADLAPDSLAYAELAVALDERFGIRLADTDLGAFRTVADLAATVRAEMRAEGKLLTSP